MFQFNHFIHLICMSQTDLKKLCFTNLEYLMSIFEKKHHAFVTFSRMITFFLLIELDFNDFKMSELGR